MWRRQSRPGALARLARALVGSHSNLTSAVYAHSYTGQWSATGRHRSLPHRPRIGMFLFGCEVSVAHCRSGVPETGSRRLPPIVAPRACGAAGRRFPPNRAAKTRRSGGNTSGSVSALGRAELAARVRAQPNSKKNPNRLAGTSRSERRRPAPAKADSSTSYCGARCSRSGSCR